MVLKTGPDRPVQLWTGLYTGPVMWKIQKFKKKGEKPVTGGLIGITGDRSGQTGSETDWDEGEKGKKHLRRLLRTIPASRRPCRHEQPRTATTQWSIKPRSTQLRRQWEVSEFSLRSD